MNEVNRILVEVTLGKRPARADTPQMAEMRRKLTADVAAAKWQGKTICPLPD